jgi:hypothetical protein
LDYFYDFSFKITFHHNSDMFACTGPFTGGHAQAVWEKPYDLRSIGRVLITHLRFEYTGLLISPLRR